MKPANLLFILSDQHQAAAMGCAGHPLVQTPNLDRLAASGTRFSNAYTNCAICVPARAALATGKYVHQIGNWDNGFPYDGGETSWMHRLKESGYQIDSIGKLHFRSSEDDNGFTREIEPLHVVEGVGDPFSGIRDGSLIRNSRIGIDEAGPGPSTYQAYDIRNRENAIAWLRDRANDEKPWVLFLSFVTPHPPFLSPQETYDLYAHDQIELPPQWRESEWVRHPAFEYMRRYFACDRPFDEASIRRLHAAYYGICTFLDAQIGQVLATLDDTGLRGNTRVVYTSDHGEQLGARGGFGKFTMYEESSAIPFIMSGPDVPVGKVVDTPISIDRLLSHCIGCGRLSVFAKRTWSDLAPRCGRSLVQMTTIEWSSRNTMRRIAERLLYATPAQVRQIARSQLQIQVMFITSMRQRSYSATWWSDPAEVNDLAIL